jgi:hypothetical protein
VHRARRARAGATDRVLTMATLANRQWVTRAEAPQRTSSMIDDLEPTYREIFLSALITLWFAVGMTALPGSEDWINTIGLVVFSIILAWAGYRQMSLNVGSLWTPLLWYRVALLSYFGIGSIVPIWVNAETQELMKGFYSYFGYEIVKLNAVVTVFNLVFLSTIKLLFMSLRSGSIGKVFSNSSNRKYINPSNFSMIVFGSMCLIVGSAVNYFIVFPQIVGWINLSFFSTLANLAVLSWLGYFMVIFWGLENNRREFIIWPIALALGEFVIGFYSMSKSVMLMPLVMVSIAFIYHHRSLLRITIFAGAFVSLFMYLSPIITHVRDVNLKYYNGAASVQDIPSLYLSYFTAGQENDEYADVETGWMRLSFVNAGTFAINQYDHATPGNSYRYWSVVWIPRIIYPKKPIITDVAREMSYAANGNYDSSSSAGLAAEAYWNGGWVATIGIAVFLALVFGLWSIYSYEVIQRKAWHLFFIVLVGMRMAIRVDGAFVSDILGPIALVVLAHIALELMNRFLPRALAGVMRRTSALQ